MTRKLIGDMTMEEVLTELAWPIDATELMDKVLAWKPIERVDEPFHELKDQSSLEAAVGILLALLVSNRDLDLRRVVLVVRLCALSWEHLFRNGNVRNTTASA